jgi:phosphoserine phosphatase
LEHQLQLIDKQAHTLQAHEISVRIANFFAGMKRSCLEQSFDMIPVVDGAQEFISFLKARRFLTAIITDSYTFLASRLATKLDIDVIWGNQLEMVENVLTGRLSMPLGWQERKNCRKKSVCKLYAMNVIAQRHGIDLARTLAVGDSENDYCMIQEAAIGVAFRPKSSMIAKGADLVIYGDFFELIERLKPFLADF